MAGLFQRTAVMTDQPIDLDHLARYTGGDRSLNAEILKLFDGQVTEMVGQLRTILAARDAKRWREVTHTIKGAARGVGAFAMGDAAAAAEPVDVTIAQARGEEVIDVLAREGHAVQLFIAEYLAA
jgi:HPt (histidine-containing phosphotransfer) domain-containing protein